MLRILSDRENGILSPMVVRRAEAARRNYNLELSKHKDVEGSLKGSVNSLDIDFAETRYLLCGCTDSSIAIYDVQEQTGHPKQKYPQVNTVLHNRGRHKHSVETVQWYPVDTGLFTSSGGDHTLKIWDTNYMKLADKFTFSGLVHCHHMSPIAMASKNCLVAVSSGPCNVTLADIKTGSQAHRLKGHDAPVLTLQWSTRDEFMLATGSGDRRVMLWDVRRAKSALMSLDQHNAPSSSSNEKARTAHDGAVNSLTFTPDGLHLVTFGTDNQLRLWDTKRGQNQMVNYGDVSNVVKKKVSMAVSFASSPQVLFVPSDCNIEVFDLFKGINLCKLNGHFNVVNCCVTQLDTQYLFSGGADRNILTWVPSAETKDYEDYLRSVYNKSDNGRTCKAMKSELATADTWSSDEDNT